MDLWLVDEGIFQLQQIRYDVWDSEECIPYTDYVDVVMSAVTNEMQNIWYSCVMKRLCKVILADQDVFYSVYLIT